MKTILKTMLLALAVSFTFAACTDDEDGVTNPGTPSNPEIESAGVYAGTWSRSLIGSTDAPKTADGTLKLEATDNAYVTNVTAVCTDLNVNYASIANITPSFAFYNNVATSSGNGFGVTFSGKADGVSATLVFTKTVKEGRKTYNYKYVFEGQKQ